MELAEARWKTELAHLIFNQRCLNRKAPTKWREPDVAIRQTGVAVATILKHYGRFVHSS
jgi:hypothetical protein